MIINKTGLAAGFVALWALLTVVVNHALAQEAGLPLIKATCTVSDPALAPIWEHMFFLEKDRIYVYCPECPEQGATTADLNWNSEQTALPQGSGETAVSGAACMAVSSPSSPDGTFYANADLQDVAQFVECEDTSLDSLYFDQECIDFNKTVVPLGVILGISLGSACGLLLIIAIICVFCVRKRTKKKEQEKAEKLAKVVVLDAPAPPPLYDDFQAGGGLYTGELIDEYGEYGGENEYDKFVYGSSDRGSLANRGNAYAAPDLSTYGMYGLEGGGNYSDIEMAVRSPHDRQQRSRPAGRKCTSTSTSPAPSPRRHAELAPPQQQSARRSWSSAQPVHQRSNREEDDTDRGARRKWSPAVPVGAASANARSPRHAGGDLEKPAQRRCSIGGSPRTPVDGGRSDCPPPDADLYELPAEDRSPREKEKAVKKDKPKSSRKPAERRFSCKRSMEIP